MNIDVRAPRTAETLVAAIVIAVSLGALVGCTAAPQPRKTNTVTASLPASPVTDRLLKCVHDAGWDAVRDLGGGITGPEMDTSQQNKYQAVVTECSKTSGWDQANNALTDAQVEELYGQELVEYRCLTKLGYAPDQPPSEQTYIDSHGTESQYYAFYPTLVGLGQGEYASVVRKCPPPTLFLNLKGL